MSQSGHKSAHKQCTDAVMIMKRPSLNALRFTKGLVVYCAVFTASLLGWITLVSAQDAEPSGQGLRKSTIAEKRVIEEVPSRYALFWSEGSTWIVDTVQGVLFKAPTLLAPGPEGEVFEYRLKVSTQRIKGVRPFGYFYRWVSLDRYLIGGQHVDQLTNHFSPEELGRDTHDEHQILQFTGEFVSLLRWFYYEGEGDSRVHNTSVYTLSLNGVQPLPKLRRAEQLLSFTRELYPSLIPSCLQTEARMVRWELGGQRPIFWLMLAPQSTQAECSAQLGALRITPTPVRRQGERLAWRDETLYDRGEVIYGGVVDALLHPRAAVAVTLEGFKRDDESLFVPQVGRLYESKSKRYLSVWRAYEGKGEGRGRHISFPDKAEIRRLDGARWIGQDHPLISMLATHFMPVEQTSCFQALKVSKSSRYRKPKRPDPSGHLCAIESQQRVWEGYEDLGAAVVAQLVNQWLHLDIWVTDPDRSPGDLIRLWVGKAEAPIELKVTPRGVISREAIRAGVKFTWVELPKRKGMAGGYRVNLQLPSSLVKQRISIAVEDEDLGLAGLLQRLWVVGRPNAAVLKQAQGDLPRPMRYQTK